MGFNGQGRGRKRLTLGSQVVLALRKKIWKKRWSVRCLSYSGEPTLEMNLFTQQLMAAAA